MRPSIRAAIGSSLLCLAASVASAADDFSKCEAALQKAAGKYASCQHKALAKYATADDFQKYLPLAAKCRTKYTATWDKIAAKFVGTGTICAGARFTSTAETVTDNLTGLMWERKTSLNGSPTPDPHDADNTYTWTGVSTSADGSVFVTFLAALNESPCFAGECDWRLPTNEELLTLMAEPYDGTPCDTIPCVDPAFIPTATPEEYWTGTTFPFSVSTAWVASFVVPAASSNFKSSANHARAVRAARW